MMGAASSQTHAGLPRPRRADVAFAAVFAVVLQAELWLGERYDGALVFSGSKPANSVLLAAMAVAFAWRRSAPMASLIGVMGAITVQSVALGGSEAGGVFALMLASVYAAAAYDPRWWATIGVTSIALIAHDLTDPQIADFGDHLYAPIFAIIGFVLGRTVRHRQQQAESERLRAERAETGAAEAVAAERARIAREIHDIVSHSVGVMVVQAGAAEQVVDSDPAAAKEALSAIQLTGRGAVDDLSRLLGLLRAGGDDAALAPQPGVREIDLLVERTRSAGLEVRVDVDPRAGALAPGVQLAIHRFVQEGLTNALKHADASTVEVTVAFDRDELRLEVSDDGVGGGGPGGGNGLVGLGERFGLYGGSVGLDQVAGGGHVLWATLPAGETSHSLEVEAR